MENSQLVCTRLSDFVANGQEVQVKVLNHVMQMTGKTAYQLFYLAYSEKCDGEEEEGELERHVQHQYKFSNQTDIVPATVYSFLLEILQGRRSV